MYFVMQAGAVWSKHHSLESAIEAMKSSWAKWKKLSLNYVAHVVRLKYPGYWRRGDTPSDRNYVAIDASFNGYGGQ